MNLMMRLGFGSAAGLHHAASLLRFNRVSLKFNSNLNPILCATTSTCPVATTTPGFNMYIAPTRAYCQSVTVLRGSVNSPCQCWFLFSLLTRIQCWIYVEYTLNAKHNSFLKFHSKSALCVNVLWVGNSRWPNDSGGVLQLEMMTHLLDIPIMILVHRFAHVLGLCY